MFSASTVPRLSGATLVATSTWSISTTMGCSNASSASKFKLYLFPILMLKLLFQNCRLKTHFATDLIQHMRDSGHDLQDPTVNCPECKSRVPMSEIEDHYPHCIQGLWTRVSTSRCQIHFHQNIFDTQLVETCQTWTKSSTGGSEEQEWEDDEEGESVHHVWQDCEGPSLQGTSQVMHFC